VISLGESCSENVVQHVSSVGCPAVNDAAVEDALLTHPHRITVNRCGSPPTGRSVSFMCGQMDDATGTARRRPSEQKDAAAGMAVPSLSVTGSPCAMHHIEDEKSCTSHTDLMRAATSPSDVHTCNCVSSAPSQL